MTGLFWVAFAVVWLAVVGYLCRRAIDGLHDEILPGDDRWRTFWRDDRR